MDQMPEENKTPVIPAPVEAPVEAPVDAPAPLDAPEHVKVINPEDDNDSVIPVPLTKKVIEVVAKRKGFYGQQRIRAGQSFSVASKESLGDWMTCVDKELEKERVAFFKNKKKKAKI